jgi:hypothetical protein
MDPVRRGTAQFSNTLKVQLKAAVPQMKALRSTTKTFYSEIVVQDETPSNPEKGKGPEVATGILVDVGSADRAKEGVEYTTTGGIGHGWHGGLCVALHVLDVQLIRVAQRAHLQISRRCKKVRRLRPYLSVIRSIVAQTPRAQ